MYRECTKCCFDETQLAEHNLLDAARWEQRQREDVTVGDKVYKNWVKKTTVEQLVEKFRHELEGLGSHQYKWLPQTRKFREIKEKVTENEMVLHIDFSENNKCIHFEGNRQQVTIHTAVSYTSQDKMLSPSVRPVTGILNTHKCCHHLQE